MKKKIAAFMVCALAATTTLGGCANANAAADTEETNISDLSDASEDENENEEITAAEMLAATDYDVTELVILPDDYMDMTIELSSGYEVTDEETESYIEAYILAYYPSYESVDKETVEDGDTVNIDFIGKMDGEEFDGGSAEGYVLTVGSGMFIDGFEDGLIDAEVGDTFDLDLTFPDDYYNEELAGEDVTFTVTVNDVVEEKMIDYDELSDDYVESNFSVYGMTTVEDLIDYVEETLVSYNESAEQTEIQNQVILKLEEGSTVNYPEEILDDRYNSYIEQVEEGAEMYGMDYDDYVLTYSGYGSVEEFETDARDILEEYLIQELILEAIVAEQQISISRSEFDAFVDTYVAYYGYESADAFYEYYGGEDYVMLSFAENRALNSVADAATIILPDGESETGAEQAEETEEAIEDEEADLEAVEADESEEEAAEVDESEAEDTDEDKD